VASPGPGTLHNYLSGVAVVAANDVWAVGAYGSKGAYSTLIEHWDGSAWSIVPGPNGGPGGSFLKSVSAVSANDIWAVGEYTDGTGHWQAFTVHWNGTTWTVVPNPGTGPVHYYLRSVAAVSANDAWALGSYESAGTGLSRSLAMRWDGIAWSIIPTPNVGSSGNWLTGMAVLAPNDIWAIDNYETGPFEGRSQLVHWDGSAWSLGLSPYTGPESHFLGELAAISANDMWAVGARNSNGPHGQTLALHWDGVEWTTIPTPNLETAGNQLGAVLAVAANDVWAVGSAGERWPLIMHWNGTAWSVERGSTSPLSLTVLHDIAQVSPNDIWAVGTGNRNTLAEHYAYQCVSPTPTSTGTRTAATTTGTVTPAPTYATYTPVPTWTPRPTGTTSPTPTPNCIPEPTAQWRTISSPEVGYRSGLSGVAIVTADDVWAVGTYSERIGPGMSRANALALHWDGTSWSQAYMPNPGTLSNDLAAVEALSADNVWAVGRFRDRGSETLRAYIMHWDGTSWAVVPSPDPGNSESTLSGIAAISPNDMWAVGTVAQDTTLTEHWDGTQWSIVPSPNMGVHSELNSVSGTASNDVWAVGFCHFGSAGPKTLALHWDGSEWSVVPTVNPNPSAADTFKAVIALAPDDAWAVGDYQDPDRKGYSTLIEHWDGVSWSVVPSPNGSEINYLWAAAGISANDVWAVGIQYNGVGPIRTLLEHWDGAQWTLVPSPNGQSQESHLTSIVGLTATEVWSVGQDGLYSLPIVPLILHYSRACAPVTVSPTTTATAITTASVTASAIATSTSTAAATVTATATASVAATATRSSTPGVTMTPTVPAPMVTWSPTPTLQAGLTCTPTSSPTQCVAAFTDVNSSDYFYQAVTYLACNRAVSGYADGTFRPYNNTTRGQLSKIVVHAESWTVDTTGGPHFSDVPDANPLYAYIETAYNRGIISGYSDGTFRWGSNVTRGQLCKIIVGAEEWEIDLAGAPHFNDVPSTHPFYGYIETAYSHQIISGYADGSFRPGNDATRGQIAKIVYNAILWLPGR
jgi:hypothetical protein